MAVDSGCSAAGTAEAAVSEQPSAGVVGAWETSVVAVEDGSVLASAVVAAVPACWVRTLERCWAAG